MLTFVCWKWVGWRGSIYKPHHVHALQRMLAEYVTIPHRLVCVTDDPSGIQCETYPIWSSPVQGTTRGHPDCYVRCFLFSEEARTVFGDRVVSIDLDCLIRGNIDHLFTDDPFKICRGAASPYNGSMWQVQPGLYPELWSELNRDGADEARRQKQPNGRTFFGSDQAWMSYRLPDHPMWTPDDGVMMYVTNILKRTHPIEDAKIVFFPGSTKPWDSELSREYMQWDSPPTPR